MQHTSEMVGSQGYTPQAHIRGGPVFQALDWQRVRSRAHRMLNDSQPNENTYFWRRLASGDDALLESLGGEWEL